MIWFFHDVHIIVVVVFSARETVTPSESLDV